MASSPLPDDDAAEVSRALALATDGASSLAMGLAQLQQRKPAVARALLAHAASMLPSDPAPLLVLAQLEEDAGHYDTALGHCAEALARSPGNVKALLTSGRVQFRSGRLQDAAAALREACERDAASVEAWSNRAAVEAALGRGADAIECATRAVGLAPQMAVLHANLGDVLRQSGRMGRALRAYERAVEREPGNAGLLNKLAGAQRLDGHLELAEGSLARALQVDPAHGLALVNLGTLRVQQQRLDEATALLRAASARPDLDPEGRREAAQTLAMLEEHARVAQPIAESVRERSPHPLERALAPMRTVRPDYDPAILARLNTLAQRLNGLGEALGGFPEWRPDPRWPSFEAHFAFHGAADSATVTSVLASRPNAATADGQPLDPDQADRARYVEAVDLCDGTYPMGGNSIALEAWLRWVHAMIVWHRPAFFPGQFKPVGNATPRNYALERARPGEAAGTWIGYTESIRPIVPPGPARALLTFIAIIDIHPFYDGNGRIARFALARELVRAGFHPLVMRDSESEAFLAARNIAAWGRDPAPLVHYCAREARWAAEALAGGSPPADAVRA